MAKRLTERPPADQGPAGDQAEAATGTPGQASAAQSETGAGAEAPGTSGGEDHPNAGETAASAAASDQDAPRESGATWDDTHVVLPIERTFVFDGLAGSDRLPFDFEIAGGESFGQAMVVKAAFHSSGVTEAEWNELPDQVRHQALELAGRTTRIVLETGREIRNLVRAAVEDEATIELTVRTRDGKPFRRAGLVFGGDWQTVLVTEHQAERIRHDPGLQLKAAS